MENKIEYEQLKEFSEYEHLVKLNQSLLENVKKQNDVISKIIEDVKEIKFAIQRFAEFISVLEKGNDDDYVDDSDIDDEDFIDDEEEAPKRKKFKSNYKSNWKKNIV